MTPLDRTLLSSNNADQYGKDREHLQCEMFSSLPKKC